MNEFQPACAPHIIDLSEWLATPGGQYVLAWERARLAQLTADIFGFNALQIGLPQLDTLAANRMPHKFYGDSNLHPRAAVLNLSLAHDLAELPFASHSLDLVVLPHVLEFLPEPHQLLREVERVLIPEGQVIICGFNPASLWGLRQLSARLRGGKFLPQDGELISMLRLKDWLKLLNMHVLRGHFGCYVPPVHSQKWLQRWAFMEGAGERWWPYFGAVYIVQAVKRVKGMHLIGPPWGVARRSVGQGVAVGNTAGSLSEIEKRSDTRAGRG
ncbi:class I SAM-dependent methyltransferase [Massilia sp. W12]|uniref:class I SAM-dependent methyltransferase n=1 Tax=Massilia sp. W12 TaxID=3126507 RepID=UPI0030D58CF8